MHSFIRSAGRSLGSVLSPRCTERRANPGHSFAIAILVVAGVLGQAGCRQVGVKDGFPCSTTGTCPAPYKCAADSKCYRTPPGGDAAVANDGGQKETGGGTGATDAAGGGADAAGGGADVSVDMGISVSPGSVESGDPCSAPADCKSTFCVDGVCCAAACTGNCVACAESYTGKPNGMCAPVNEGMDPHDTCQATAPESCGNDGMCDGKGACRKHGSNQSCADATCMGTKFVASRSCDGAGACAAARTTECGTAACTTSGCALPCTGDLECGTGAYCAGGTCKVKGANGESCGGTTQCLSGFCVDGVCCETACTGACMACAESGTGQKSGRCQPVQAGKDTGDDCPTDAPTTCGRDGTCDGLGACRKYDSTTTCAEASCSGKTFTPARKCAAGACAAATAVDCGQAQCAVEGCRQGCSVDTDCSTTAYCVNGTCVAKKGNGADCTAGGQCTSKACVDGKCCETACAGKCYACAMGRTGQADGKCAPVTSGTDPDSECADSAASTCSTDGMCDGAGACRLWSKGTQCAAGMCNSAGNYLSARTCDGLGTCGAATTDVCAPNVCAATGCSRTCSTDAECLGNTYCAGTTCAAKKTAGMPCGTSNNQCASGFCVDTFCCDARCDGKCSACSNAKTGQANGKCAPVPTGSDPDNECASDATKPCGLDGFCNGAGACRMPAVNTACGTAACAPPNLFTPAGTCDGAGMCNLGTQRACAGGLTCVANSNTCKATCSNDNDCVSGNYCSNGSCLPKKNAGATCNVGTECGTGFCSADKHCCNNACSASGCQSCTTGTCTTTANTATDPNNCGSCGNKCPSKIASHGAPKCMGSMCVEACAAGYLMCMGPSNNNTCVSSRYGFDDSPHVWWTCGPYGGRGSATEFHGSSPGLELQGTGDPNSPECIKLDIAAYFSPGCDGVLGSTAGATVSVWVKALDWAAGYSPSCTVFTDAGNTAKRNLTTKNSWTQMTWVLPASLLSTGQLEVRCDLPDAEYFYIDDFSITPAP
jgi:hypothetical protein